MQVMPRCEEYQGIFQREEKLLGNIRDGVVTNSKQNLVLINEDKWNSLIIGRIFDKNFLMTHVCGLCPESWTTIQLKLSKIKKYITNNTIIAGGSIFSILFGIPMADIDVFFTNTTEADAINHMRILNTNSVSVTRGYNCVSFNVKDDKETEKTEETEETWKFQEIQTILRLYKSLSEVLHGFDIDSCCVGYDGTHLYATERFWYSLEKGRNSVNLDRLSPSYEMRLCKYARRGMPITVEGFQWDMVNKDYQHLKEIAMNIKQDETLLGLDIIIFSDLRMKDPKIEALNEKFIQGDYEIRAVGEEWISCPLNCAEYMVPKGFIVYAIRIENRELFDKLLYIDDEDYTALKWDHTKRNVKMIPQRMTFKIVNPGEQTTGSFNKTVLQNPEVWGFGFFIPAKE